MSKATEQSNAPRFRLATDIDLSTAKPGCKRCNGTGVKGHKSVDDPNNEGESIRVPVICRCVTRRGGVKEDMLDKICLEMARQLEDGTFAETLARDIMGLPMEQRARAITMLENDLDNPDKSEETIKCTREALDKIREMMKEESHGDA